MGELIPIDFSAPRPERLRDRQMDERPEHLRDRPADEPKLFTLSAEEKVQLAVERDLDIKRIIVDGIDGDDGMRTFMAAVSASLRVKSLLNPDQQLEAMLRAQELFDQEPIDQHTTGE